MIATTLAEIAAAVGGRVSDADGPLAVTGPVVTDSREAEPGSLFVARVGEHDDGHAHAARAAARGAVALLGTRTAGGLPAVLLDDAADSGLQAADVALGRLAHDVLARSPATVVAVTGSSGKTSTKDLLAPLFARAGQTVAAQGSYNGEVGVPLTVLRVTDQTRYLMLEMGARGVGHIAYLTRIVPPDVSIVLNVGTAHLGEFGSREAIAEAKSELVQGLRPGGLAVLNADDPIVAAMAARLAPGVQLLTTGISGEADVRAADVTLDAAARASFTLHTPAGSAPVTLRLHGAHHVANALAAAAAAVGLGLTVDDVAASLSAATPLSRWRMEVTGRPDGVTIVNDAYNANPESMAAALRALTAMTSGGSTGGSGRSWAVLGEMRELGVQSAAEHEAIGRLAVGLGVDRVLAVGGGALPIHRAADESWPAGRSTWVADLDQAEQVLAAEMRPGDVVLVKSSRDAGLRHLGDRLVLADELVKGDPVR